MSPCCPSKRSTVTHAFLQEETASTFGATTRQPQLQRKQISGAPDAGADRICRDSGLIRQEVTRVMQAARTRGEGTSLLSFRNWIPGAHSERMDSPASYHITMGDNYALVQELKEADERIQDIQFEQDDVEMALKEDQEEVESYTDEIADCCDRINAIDEFVRDIEAGNVPALADVASVKANMVEERQEEEAMLKRLGEVRACHEQQIQQLNTQLATIQEEKLMLQKRSAQIWNILGRTAVVELVLRHLAQRSVKVL